MCASVGLTQFVARHGEMHNFAIAQFHQLITYSDETTSSTFDFMSIMQLGGSAGAPFTA